MVLFHVHNFMRQLKETRHLKRITSWKNGHAFKIDDGDCIYTVEFSDRQLHILAKSPRGMADRDTMKEIVFLFIDEVNSFLNTLPN